MDVFRSGRVLPFISSILLLSLGILIVIIPETLGGLISLILGAVLIAVGIMHIAYSIINGEFRDVGGRRMTLGLTTTMFGGLLLAWYFTGIAMVEISLIVALWGIINGSIKLANFPTLMVSGGNFVWEIVFGALQILLGVDILFMHLFTTQFWTWITVGALTIVSGLSVLIMTFCYKREASSISDYRRTSVNGGSHNPHYA